AHPRLEDGIRELLGSDEGERLEGPGLRGAPEAEDLAGRVVLGPTGRQQAARVPAELVRNGEAAQPGSEDRDDPVIGRVHAVEPEDAFPNRPQPPSLEVSGSAERIDRVASAERSSNRVDREVPRREVVLEGAP